jgi:hypothetical protein
MDDQKLKDIFKFDEGDLLANRSGNLSEKQKNEIVKRRKEWKKNRIKLQFSRYCHRAGDNCY